MLMQILPDMQNHAHEDLAHVECQQKSEEKKIWHQMVIRLLLRTQDHYPPEGQRRGRSHYNKAI